MLSESHALSCCLFSSPAVAVVKADLDLGNYERFLDVTLSRDHNITTGKVYNEVIMKERRGDYLGKTVQVVPHVTDEIQVMSCNPTYIGIIPLAIP